jgi:hypothetical protein
MDGFLGGLKPKLRERMSFKEYKNLNDLVKATEKRAAVLNEAKLKKRNVEFVNSISVNANGQEWRETKNEISELKSVAEQLAQKLETNAWSGKSKEAIKNITMTSIAQITESKREIEELKNLLRASNKNYSDMMKQSRDVEKAMKNLQIQVAGTSQQTLQAQPVMHFQPNHSSQFVDKSYQGAQQTPQYNNNNQSKQSNGYGEKRHCVHCAAAGRTYGNHNSDMCSIGPGGLKCFKCKGSGHFSKNCTALQNSIGIQNGPPGQNGGQGNPFNQRN